MRPEFHAFAFWLGLFLFTSGVSRANRFMGDPKSTTYREIVLSRWEVSSGLAIWIISVFTP